MTEQDPTEQTIIPRGGLQQWLMDQGRTNRDRFFQDWLTKAYHAASLDPGEPWPAWSAGEVLAVALILRRTDVLDRLGYTEDEALDRIRFDIGADHAEIRTFFTDLRNLV